ncbi:MAG: hypothetical protein IJE68_01390 [Clostridia bacterium]|nr:hypothetical protein [Clostridia bacterium]
MLDFIEKEKLRIEDFLKNSEEHQDKKIQYILYKEDTKETNILAINEEGTLAIEFTPITKESKEGYWDVPGWDFNYDYYMYNLLEENWEIAYITPNIHYDIWNSINELYPEDIDYKDGVQKYLKYCKENNITKEYLDKEMESVIPNANTPDIMKYLDDLEVSDTFEYKGYFIQVDDYNLDNEDENIIQIYENEQSYIDGENIESVSLSKYGLRQNIKDYIDETYFQPEIEQRHNECKVYMPSEKAYLCFILGYDFLQDMLKKSGTPECDINYDFCNYLSEQFLQSEEYKDPRHSTYEMLEQWITENKEQIKEDYIQFIEKGIDGIEEQQEVLKVKIIGIDNWDRPVYQDEKGKLYKDVNLGTGCLSLCTATNNQFYGEPDIPIADNIKVEVVKNFSKNKNKDMER